VQYRLADHGLVFSTRDRGARMLADILEKLGAAPIESAVIDFASVHSVSYSFVDEFIGGLMQRAGASPPTLVNVSESAARTIERSLRRRGLDADNVITTALEPA
jgi:anti-anti-sigma regulatory factor